LQEGQELISGEDSIGYNRAAWSPCGG